MSLYRRLAGIETETEREAFAAELIDRFGALPEETVQLMEITAIKTLCKQLGITKLDAGPKGALITFRDDTILEPQQLLMIVRTRPSKLRIRPDSKLVYSGIWPAPDRRMADVKSLLTELLSLTQGG